MPKAMRHSMPMQSTTRTRQNMKIPKKKNKKNKKRTKRTKINANPQEKTGPVPETVNIQNTVVTILNKYKKRTSIIIIR